MPSSKKKGDSKQKQEERRAKHRAAGATDEFRDLLHSARKLYAKGRAYEAVDKQNQAIALGSEKLTRFDNNSLVKAHALMELALAKSAIQTDFARGEEWIKVRQETKDALAAALSIFEYRVANNTLAKFRKDEVWFTSSGDYASPVPHTERLGPIDYLSCVNFVGGDEPSPSTVKSIKIAMKFVRKFEASGCVIMLEVGGGLQGQLPGGDLSNLNHCLQEHEAVVSGRKSMTDYTAKGTLKAPPNHVHGQEFEEVRHTGARSGDMKATHQKLAKDIDRIGLKHCARPDCGKFESHPRHFSTCSRCKFAAYCSKECQKKHWPEHKKACKSGEAAKNLQELETQNKLKNCLMVGQSQQVLTIVRCLHHFATLSDEMAETKTQQAAIVLHMVKPKYGDAGLGTKQLGVQEVGFTWNAIWSMSSSTRNKMIRKFLGVMSEYSFGKNGPDCTVVKEWGMHAVAGDFAVVKHTKKGTVLLYEDPQNKGDIKAYMAVGITQSLEFLLKQIPQPLPMFINTALFPFKNMVLCQGTIVPAMGDISPKFGAAARSFVNGDDNGMKIIEHF